MDQAAEDRAGKGGERPEAAGMPPELSPALLPLDYAPSLQPEKLRLIYFYLSLALTLLWVIFILAAIVQGRHVPLRPCAPFVLLAAWAMNEHDLLTGSYWGRLVLVWGLLLLQFPVYGLLLTLAAWRGHGRRFAIVAISLVAIHLAAAIAASLLVPL